jgi:hypothetical protein
MAVNAGQRADIRLGANRGMIDDSARNILEFFAGSPQAIPGLAMMSERRPFAYDRPMRRAAHRNNFPAELQRTPTGLERAPLAKAGA